MSAAGDPPVAGATWRSLRAGAAGELGRDHEARLLVEEVSGLGAAALALALDERAPEGAAQRLADLVARRRAGEPLQHVVGHWSFRTVELTVDGRALVPRPETEVVVGHALAELARRRAALAQAVAALGPTPGADDSPVALVAVDLGTGSGAIACAILAESDDVEVVGVDASSDAVDLARENVERLGPARAARARLVVGDWYGGIAEFLHGLVDCVVANPPYLAAGEWAGLDPVVRDHDPYDALVAGPTGLEAVEAIVEGAPAVLAPGGALVVEIAPGQADAAAAFAHAAGAVRVEIARDLAGRDRVLVAQW